MMVNLSLHTFLLLTSYADIDDKVLRDLGFGYRAPYVINTCKTIAEKGPGWLEGIEGEDAAGMQGSFARV